MNQVNVGPSQSADPEVQAALGGMRVLDLAEEKGAYCGKLLAQMGADVIKIEPPSGCSTRAIPPFWRDEPHPEHSLYFLYMNTDKRSITLDIAKADGQDIFRRFAGTADAVIETFAPGYLDELGLGYAVLSKISRGLVMTSITGFGQTGPYKHYKSCDMVAQALGGAMHNVGFEEDPPVKMGSAQADVVASLHAAAATMIAVFHRRITGLGQHVDISMEEAMVSVTHIAGVAAWLADGIVPKRQGDRVPVAPCGVFRCKDGSVFIMINKPVHWQALAKWIHEVTAIQEVIDPMFEGPSAVRLPYRDLLNHYVAELTSRFSVAEVFHEGQRRHITITPLNNARSISEDAHLAAREYFVALDHSVVGTLLYPGAPYRLSETPWRFERAAPQLGEHNVEVYCQELGISRTELARYQELGLV